MTEKWKDEQRLIQAEVPWRQWPGFVVSPRMPRGEPLAGSAPAKAGDAAFQIAAKLPLHIEGPRALPWRPGGLLETNAEAQRARGRRKMR